MKKPPSLRYRHVIDNEVKFKNGKLRSAIEVNKENRGSEEISYSMDREKYVESALSHRHGPTTYRLNPYRKKVFTVLKEADEHFQLDKRLIELYPDLKWRGNQSDDMYWEGQRSIIVGRCGRNVVSLACLDLRFVSDAQDSRTKYLSVGLGPFFVPTALRGRAHCLEMSIAVAHLCTVLHTALYQLLPRTGCLGVSVYSDIPGDIESDFDHPFALQVYDKLVVMQELLATGYLFKHPSKCPKITFLPVTIEC